MQPLATHVQVLDKVLLKAVQKGKSKEEITFVISPTTVRSLGDLKTLIKDNFSKDMKHDFDVGSSQGKTVIRVRSRDDFLEMWSEIKKNKNTCLWCDGLVEEKSKRKRKYTRSCQASLNVERKSWKGIKCFMI